VPYHLESDERPKKAVPPADDVAVEASLLQSPEPTSEPQNWA
jgi:hypothetical protein